MVTRDRIGARAAPGAETALTRTGTVGLSTSRAGQPRYWPTRRPEPSGVLKLPYTMVETAGEKLDLLRWQFRGT